MSFRLNPSFAQVVIPNVGRPAEGKNVTAADRQRAVNFLEEMRRNGEAFASAVQATVGLPSLKNPSGRGTAKTCRECKAAGQTGTS